MLTPNGFKNTLASLLMGVELTEELENAVSILQNDFEERNVIIEKYGNKYDCDLDSYDFVEKTNENNNGEDYREKYLTLKEKYVNRFMGKELGNDENVTDENVTDENENDENVTIEDLFENKGDM